MEANQNLNKTNKLISFIFIIIFFISAILNTKAYELETNNTEIEISGGISSEYTYQTNFKENIDTFSIYNLYITLSSKNSNNLDFKVGIGTINTPSVLDIIEKNISYQINTFNASLILNYIANVEIGILEPIEGYETTQTFYNPNIIASAVSSIEPFNAYGIRISLNKENSTFYFGYYPARYDKEEYCYKDLCANEAFNLAYELNKEKENIYFFISYYDLKNFFNFINLILSKETDNIELSFNIDFAFWDKSTKDHISKNTKENLDYSASGISIYVIPKINKFNLPIRIEYIHQGKSQIYIQDKNTRNIYSLSLTPTYFFSKNSFIRFEINYTYAKEHFTIHNKEENQSVLTSGEITFLF